MGLKNSILNRQIMCLLSTYFFLTCNFSIAEDLKFERAMQQNAKRILAPQIEIVKQRRDSFLEILNQRINEPYSIDQKNLRYGVIANHIRTKPNQKSIIIEFVATNTFRKQNPNSSIEEVENFRKEVRSFLTSPTPGLTQSGWKVLMEAATPAQAPKTIGDAVSFLKSTYDRIQYETNQQSITDRTGAINIGQLNANGIPFIAKIIEEETAISPSAMREVANYHGIPYTFPDETNRSFGSRSLVEPGVLNILDNLDEHTHSISDVRTQLLKLVSKVDAIRNNQSEDSKEISKINNYIARLDGQRRIQEATEAFEDSVQRKFLPIHSSLTMLGTILGGRDKETQAAIITASYFARASETIYRLNMASTMQGGLKIPGFDPSKLKLDLAQLPFALFGALLSIFGDSGPSEVQLLREEVEKLHSDMKRFEGATISRLDELSASLKVANDRIVRVLSVMNDKISSTAQGVTEVKRDLHIGINNDSLHRSKEVRDSRRKKREADLLKTEEASAIFQQASANSEDFRSGRKTWSQNELAAVNSIKLPTLSQQFEKGSELGLIQNQRGFTLPRPEEFKENALTDNTNQRYQLDTSDDHSDDSTWISYAETARAALETFHQRFSNRSITPDEISSIQTLSPINGLTADPDILAKKIAAFGIGIHSFREAKSRGQTDQEFLPGVCTDLANILLQAYQTQISNLNFIPKDSLGRLDIIVVMQLAENYLHELGKVKQILDEKRKNLSFLQNPESLRKWAEERASNLFVDYGGRSGIGACAIQKSPSSDLNGAQQYPPLDVTQLENLGYPIKRWMDYVPDEALQVYYSLGGKLKLCYEWVNIPSSTQYEMKGFDLVVKRNAYVGLKIRTLYSPPDIANGLDPKIFGFHLDQTKTAFITDKLPGENPFLVLGETQVISPSPIPSLWTESWAASIRRGGFPPETGLIPELPRYPPVLNLLRNFMKEKYHNVLQTPQIDGWKDTTKPEEATRTVAATFFNLTHPTMSEESQKNWVLGLIKTLQERKQSPSLQTVGWSHNIEGPIVDVHQTISSYENRNADYQPRLKSVSAALWETSKAAIVNSTKEAEEAFQDPFSDLMKRLNSLEGARKLLKNVLLIAEQNLPDEGLREALIHLTSKEDILKLRKNTGTSFLSQSGRAIDHSQDGARNLLLALSNPFSNLGRRDSSILEKAALNGFDELNSLIENRNEFKIDPDDCNPERKSLKALLKSLNAARKQLQDLQNLNAGSPSNSFFKHDLYNDKDEQRKVTDLIHQALKGDTDILKLSALVRAAKAESSDLPFSKLLKEELNLNQVKLPSLSAQDQIHDWLQTAPSGIQTSKPASFVSRFPSAPLLRINLSVRICELFKSRMAQYSEDQRKTIKSSLGIEGEICSDTWPIQHMKDNELTLLDEYITRLETLNLMRGNELSAPDILDKVRVFAEMPTGNEAIEAELNRFVAEILIEEASIRISKLETKNGDEFRLAPDPTGNLSESIINETKKLVSILGGENLPGPILRERTSAKVSRIRGIYNPKFFRKDSTKDSLRANVAAVLDKNGKTLEQIQKIDSLLSQIPEAQASLVIRTLSPSLTLKNSLLSANRITKSRENWIHHAALYERVEKLEKILELQEKYNRGIENPNDQISLALPGVIMSITIEDLDAILKSHPIHSQNHFSALGRFMGKPSINRNELMQRFDHDTLSQAISTEKELVEFLRNLNIYLKNINSKTQPSEPLGLFAGMKKEELDQIGNTLAEAKKIIAPNGQFAFLNERLMALVKEERSKSLDFILNHPLNFFINQPLHAETASYAKSWSKGISVDLYLKEIREYNEEMLRLPGPLIHKSTEIISAR